MGSRSFRFIHSDGSRPMMTVGGDIKAYENCLLRFKDAWTLCEDLGDDLVDEAVGPAFLGQAAQSDEISQTTLALVQAAYLRGSWPRRQARLLKPCLETLS